MFRLFFLFNVVYCLQAFGQYAHSPVLPELQGTALLETLQAEYSPDQILDFSDAKDTMFAKIYKEGDSITCVYSGWTIYMDPNGDPSQVIYQNGTNEGFNTEHCYPQSLGSKVGGARADIHHLFPTRVPVNGARSNDPFMEIPDQQVDKWFYQNQTLENKPSSQIDLYSEDRNQGFEPREDFKGNVARAMFYFYTIYKEQADAIDDTYFEQQKEILCQWHHQDPVDSLEWIRNWRIAAYQGKPNPFILDCSLAGRGYCDTVITDCMNLVPTEEIEVAQTDIVLFPNPGQDRIYIQSEGDLKIESVVLYDISGRYIDQMHLHESGSNQFYWDQKRSQQAWVWVKIYIAGRTPVMKKLFLQP